MILCEKIFIFFVLCEMDVFIFWDWIVVKICLGYIKFFVKLGVYDENWFRFFLLF